MKVKELLAILCSSSLEDLEKLQQENPESEVKIEYDEEGQCFITTCLEPEQNKEMVLTK